MNKVLKYWAVFCLTGFSCAFACAQQPKLIDQVVAVIGGKMLLHSEVETQYLQYLAQGNYRDEGIKCQLIDQLLLQKLLLNQAVLDSVDVPEAQVEGELDRRIRYFINQLGSQERLEEFYKKTVVEIKADFRDVIRDQLLVETMQSKITKGVTATPSDVRSFFESIPADSLPYVNSKVEVAQIVRKPKIGPEEKKRIKDQLEGFRQRILKGEDFAALAVLYSKDRMSARKGGEIGFVNRGDLVPEFEAVAFNLQPGEVSPIVETQYGFHIVQLVERRGDQVNVRHILLKPEVMAKDLQEAKNFLDSIVRLIKTDSLSFEEAAARFSDDADTKNNGGLLVNPQTGSSRFEADELDPTVFFQADKMEPGEVSEPVLTEGPDGQQAYRLIMVKSRTKPHRMNLKDDYQDVQNLVLSRKQNETLTQWIVKKKQQTYISIIPEYSRCDILKDWVN